VPAEERQEAKAPASAVLGAQKEIGMQTLIPYQREKNQERQTEPDQVRVSVVFYNLRSRVSVVQDDAECECRKDEVYHTINNLELFLNLCCVYCHSFFLARLFQPITKSLKKLGALFKE